MKNNLVKIIFITILMVLAISFESCNNNKKISCINAPVEEVKVSAMDSIPSSLGDDVSFIMLQEPQNTFAEINSIQVFNDTIYIFDKNTRNMLLSFDQNGKCLATFGQKGNAKNEYSRLWAFDVDKQYVYMYDRAKMKMLFFTHDGKFIKAVNTNFRGDSFKVLADGNYLFSMPQSDSHNKLCLVDNNFNITNVLLTFNEKDMDNLANCNLFQRADDRIIYNKELSDTIYAFSDKGKCIKSYCMDFSGLNVPQEYKYDFEKLMEDAKEDSYAYIDDCPMIYSSMMIVPVSYKGRHGVVYYDLQGKTVLNANGVKGEVPNPLCVSGGKIYGWMELDSYRRYGKKSNVPDEVVTFLNNGGRVIVFS